ncbi:MAG: outer membrane protein insertion porin family [Flavobacteriales bacterium]|jgi:outer membrane protein insertion porin family
MRQRGLSIFLVCLTAFSLDMVAQDQVDGIEISGLKHTKAQYIAHFLKLKTGEIASETQLKEDLQQLKNLLMVANATAEIVHRNDSTIIQYQIEEALTLFPIINLGGVKENVWFQVGAKEQNLGGRGIQALAYYMNNNGLNNGQLFVRIPYLAGTRWGLSVNIQRWSSPEPLFFNGQRIDYTYSSSIAGLGIIREFSYQHTLELGGGYFVENYEREATMLANVDFFAPPNARIPKTIGKITHHLGKMNYHLFYLNGWDMEQYGQLINDLNSTNEDLFWIYWTNLRYLKTIGKRQKCNIALRGRVGISSNGDTPFAPFVIDSQMNVRGVGNRIDRGTATAVLNIEVRQTLNEQRNWALQGVLFSDAGTWRKPAGELSDLFQKENIIHFAGVGLRGIYKKAHNAIIRVDYGFDVYNVKNNGLVLGLGQYF